MTETTGLIIGLTGKLCTDGEEVIELINRRYQNVQQFKLKNALDVKKLINFILQYMEDNNMNKDIMCLEDHQLNNLKTKIDEFYRLSMNFDQHMQDIIPILKFTHITFFVTPITQQYQLDIFCARNQFHLIEIIGTTQHRYEIFKKKYAEIPLSLFCLIDDIISVHLKPCLLKAKIQIQANGNENDMLINIYANSAKIFRSLRPDWNHYFMNIAHVVKARSNCMKRAVGCVVVLNDRIVATGYNGTPKGKKNCWEQGCVRCNTNTKQGVDLEKCFCFHAEENAILEIGTNKSKGMVLYTTLFPCLQCTKIILVAVFYLELYFYFYFKNKKGIFKSLF